MNGHLVGTWSFSSADHAFAYDRSWLENPLRRPISLSMPLRGPAAPYRGDVVRSFFDNLLPDAESTRLRLQAKLGADSTDPFALLEHLGKDCLGALQLLKPGKAGVGPESVEGEPLSEAEVAEILRGLPQSPMGAGKDTPLRLSLAGNHEKTALLQFEGQWLRPLGPTPTTHIFKLPIGVTKQMDLKLSVENEWLCHRLLQELGLPVAPATIATFEDQKCLIVTRFDRSPIPGKGILRLPHEDFCQATGTLSARKYESEGGPGIKACLKLLSGSQSPEQDKEVFFKAQLAFWMLCAIDGHAKNFSLAIEPLGRYRMAPLYDVLSAYPILGHGRDKLAPQKTEMAMAVWGKNRHYKWAKIHKRHWAQTATDCGIPNVDQLIESLARSLGSAVERVSESLPSGFPGEVCDPIFEGVLKAGSRLV